MRLRCHLEAPIQSLTAALTERRSSDFWTLGYASLLHLQSHFIKAQIGIKYLKLLYNRLFFFFFLAIEVRILQGGTFALTCNALFGIKPCFHLYTSYSSIWAWRNKPHATASREGYSSLNPVPMKGKKNNGRNERSNRKSSPSWWSFGLSTCF